MTIIYHVNTSNYLPCSKKFFDCKCKAYEYLKAVMDMVEDDLEKWQQKASVKVTRIDTELVPHYRKLFAEKDLGSNVSKFYKKQVKKNI